MDSHHNMVEYKAEIINLTVMAEDRSVVICRVRRHTLFGKIMMKYSQQVGIPVNLLLFRFDGESINETDRPFMLGLEEGDMIEVYRQQTAG
ncbi:unnamed protein product [Ceutorhynchus assimilis]|uniref:Rad60/SUMO-like domain-containing protein n=1 Tax=Ceutorhynchus assimilis TaxID=467358 RepID=A0A9N9M8Z1_9CUCU|nr:unnamed protein product [Ceutorhynchus assimilis]